MTGHPADPEHLARQYRHLNPALSGQARSAHLAAGEGLPGGVRAYAAVSKALDGRTG